MGIDYKEHLAVFLFGAIGYMVVADTERKGLIVLVQTIKHSQLDMLAETDWSIDNVPNWDQSLLLLLLLRIST